MTMDLMICMGIHVCIYHIQLLVFHKNMFISSEGVFFRRHYDGDDQRVAIFAPLIDGINLYADWFQANLDKIWQK